MSEDQGIIILRYEPGPAAGMLIVVIDAPGYTQAPFVIDEKLKGTPEETRVLRRMLDERLKIAAISQEKEF